MQRSIELEARAQRCVEEEMDRFNIIARRGLDIEIAALKQDIVGVTMFLKRINKDADLWYILSRKLQYYSERLDAILWTM